MSFESHESSESRGSPVELYEFVYGDTVEAVYRYTNHSQDIVRGGRIWIARAIRRAAYRSSGKVEKANLEIRMPVDTDLAALFTDFPPTQVVRVTVWGGHKDDPDEQYLVIWTGRVLSVAKEEREAVLTCDSTLISMKRAGLRRNYQYACPYVLYGRGCRADQDAATRKATVVDIQSNGIALSADWWGDHPPQKYAGGMLKWRGATGWEFRTIRGVRDDGAIQFIGPIRGIVVGQTISVILGCNRTMDDCENLHANIVNYGGQPWIPTSNPTRYHPFW